MDTLTPEVRSEVMRRVRSKNTRPEMAVRRVLHGLGYRFRLHRPDLPGKPDIVLPRLRTVVFVHGCFWHRHPNCRRATVPASNAEFWSEKFSANERRDRRAKNDLRRNGWRVIVVWECEILTLGRLSNRLDKLLRSVEDQ
jgi:DNA mismatch endonuclease (patch repair protein)